MVDNCVAPWRDAHLDVPPRCHWPLDERKGYWGNLRCCIQWYQQHVKWEGVAKGNARFPHGDHSFTAAVHIGWYHRGSKHCRRTGNGTQYTIWSYVGWLLHYPHLLSPPVRPCRAGRWLAPAYVLAETHAAILLCKFPLELCSIHTLVHPGYACKSTTSYQEQYLTDRHICQHAAGVWNAISEEQFGEQTYIRYGKSKGGLVGISLPADQVAGWVLSHHMCDTLALAMDEMFVNREYDERADKHKEETEGNRFQQLCECSGFSGDWHQNGGSGQASLITFTNHCQSKWLLWSLWRRASQLAIGRFMTLRQSNLGC